MDQTELGKTYAAQINEAYALCEGDGADATKAIVKIANSARNVGLLLVSAKEQVGHGRWQSWIRDNLIFGETKAVRFMRLSRAHPEEITDFGEALRLLKEAQVACGHLSVPGREHEQTAKLYDFFSTITKRATDVVFTFQRQIAEEPIADWPEARREAIKEQLRPIAEIYAEL